MWTHKLETNKNWHGFGGKHKCTCYEGPSGCATLASPLGRPVTVVLFLPPQCLLSFSPLMLAHCAHHRLMPACCPAPEKPPFSSAYLASWPRTKKMPRFKLENSFHLDLLLPYNLVICFKKQQKLP